LDLGDVRTFLDVADAGSVSSAARRLGVSKQSLADGSRASNKRPVSNFYRARRVGLRLQKPARLFVNMPLE
jgi:hypothetical protein